MSAPALLVFDLDGTLVPTMEDYADRAASLMKEAYGTPFASARADYFRTSGLPFSQQLRELYPQHDDTDAVAEQFEQWKDGYLNAVTLVPNIAVLLQAWGQAGIRIAISSNNLESYVQRVARDWPVMFALGYRPADGFGKGEPHFSHLEAETGVSRAHMLFVGDSPNDARIAARCGIRFRALMTAAFTANDFRAVDPEIVIIGALAELTSQFA